MDRHSRNDDECIEYFPGVNYIFDYLGEIKITAPVHIKTAIFTIQDYFFKSGIKVLM